MTAAVLFALYAAAAGMLAPAMLRGQWAGRAPRLAMALWLVLPVSWAAAVVLAILAATGPLPLTWPAPPPGGERMLEGPAVPGGPAIAVAGLVLAAAVVLRAVGCLALELYHGRRSRREHAALIAATGHPGPAHDVVILNYDAPSVYCLTSGRGRIVVSAGALAALTPEQLRAVIAHERAHLRSRHHAMLALASGLARAFHWVALLAQAEVQLCVLAEMAADDAAVRVHRRDDLAAALVVLAGARPRPAALTAGGPAAMVRLQRLLTRPERGTRPAELVAIAGLLPAVAVTCVPLIVALCGVITHLG